MWFNGEIPTSETAVFLGFPQNSIVCAQYDSYKVLDRLK